MPPYEALLFDFDGVLVDSEPVHYSCWVDLIAPFGYAVTWEDFAANCVGVHERGTVAWLCAQRNPPVPFEDLWALYPRKKEMFRERMTGVDPIRPGVVSLLRQLSERYSLGVVTSSGQVEVEPVLERAGILPLLKGVVYGGDVKNLKPAPDPYLLAIERVGTSNALVMEDSIPGVASGTAAGLDVLRIPRQNDLEQLVLERLGLSAAVMSEA